MSALGYAEQPPGANDDTRGASAWAPARGGDVRRVVLRIPDLRPSGANTQRAIDRNGEFVVHGAHSTIQGMHAQADRDAAASTHTIHGAHALGGMHSPPTHGVSTAGDSATTADVEASPGRPHPLHRIEAELKSLNPLAKTFNHQRFDSLRSRFIAIALVLGWIKSPAILLTGVALVSAQLTALVVWLESSSSPAPAPVTLPFPKSSFAAPPVDPASLPIQTPVSAPLLQPRDSMPTLAPTVAPTASPAGSASAPVVPMPLSSPPRPRFQAAPRLGDPVDSLPWDSVSPNVNVPEASAKVQPSNEPAAPASSDESLKTAKKSRFLGTIEPRPLEPTP